MNLKNRIAIIAAALAAVIALALFGPADPEGFAMGRDMPRGIDTLMQAWRAAK